MAVNRIDLLTHAFSRVIRGYDTEEVDTFLQDVADTLGRLSDERLRLHNKVTQLEARVEEYAEREGVLREALVTAQRMNEGTRAAAQKEAQLIIESAQNRAENLTNQANLRLARILDEISEARKLKAQFEFKVRSVIEGHLKLLELGRMDDMAMERATTALSKNLEAAEDGRPSGPLTAGAEEQPAVAAAEGA